MPRKILPRIAAVSADKKPLTLRITWHSGAETRVDVSGLIETFRVYAPLRRSRKLFGSVRVGEHGTPNPFAANFACKFPAVVL